MTMFDEHFMMNLIRHVIRANVEHGLLVLFA